MPDHTRTVPDFAAARSYVLDRLERELSPRLVYHSVVHTRDDILPALERLAEREGITDEHELVVLRTAGLYHDIGFTETYAGHEIASIRIAAETLPGFGYSQAQIEQICHLIEATEMPQNPDSRLAKLLADADLDILGREDFLIRNRDLYWELADMGKDFTLTEWCSSQLTLLQTHRYFTRAATELRQAGKEQNMARLQDQLAGSSNPDSPATGKASTGEKIEDILARIPLFTTLPKEELAHLGQSLELIEYPVPTLLFREGDHGDFMYLVIEGFIEIFKALGTPDERRIGLRGSGEYVGEISMLAPDGLRTASACTKEYTRLLVMTRSDFEGLLARRPTLATEFTRVLISRLNESHTNAIRDLQEKNVRLSRAYEDLKNAQDQLIKQERMERELQVAYEIQMSILPEAMPDFAGFDFGALIVPAREVGGDFFDLLPLQDGKMGIVIGDITDKGVPAAIFMAQTHALLRASASHTKSPGQTLLEINQLLLGMNTRNMFATILYGILDGQTRQFSYARAGHELPIVLKPSGEIEIGEHGVGMPVGIFEEPKIDEQTLILPPGSILLLYTDGATDALVTDERRFGMEGLLEAFRKAANLPAQEVCKTIFNSLVVEGRPELRIDDVTLVVICSLD